jgi:hypothetical protein
MLIDALGFLNVGDQNEVRLPVVKYLASQRASSIHTLVTYCIAVRLVLTNRISLQHCRPVDYVQEPNAEPASSRRNLLGETGMLLLWIAERRPSMRAVLVCLSCFVAWGFGFCHTGLWARPRPGALGGALVMPRKPWSGPVLPPPKFPGVRGGHHPSWNLESCLPVECWAI